MSDDGYTPEQVADLLGGTAYPDGREWRCTVPDCGYATDDDGPDRCPTHDTALWRTSVTFPLHGGST